MKKYNQLKIDLDIKTKSIAIKQIRNRLCYMQDIGFMNCDIVKKIELIHKTSYGCLMTLNSEFGIDKIVCLQLIFGSDHEKEINTLKNYYIHNMKEYPNRLFTTKRYPNGVIKSAKIIDVTKEIIDFVKDKDRPTNYN